MHSLLFHAPKMLPVAFPVSGPGRESGGPVGGGWNVVTKNNLAPVHK